MIYQYLAHLVIAVILELTLQQKQAIVTKLLVTIYPYFVIEDIWCNG